MLGSTSVIATLLEAVATPGRSSMFALRAPAGSGKTWTVKRFIDELSADVLVLKCTGHSAETDLPFGGLHELVADHRLDGLPPHQRRALSAAVSRESGDHLDRLAIAAGLLSLVTEAANSRPVVVVVDDLHWVDASTRACLVFVARRLRHDAVTLVVTFRDGEAIGLAAELERSQFCMLDLARLTERESRVLLRTHHPDLTALETHRVLGLAAGLPLALVHLPAELNTGSESDPQSSMIFSSGGPLHELFRARLSALTAHERLALLTVSFDELTLVEAERALALLGASLDDLAPARQSGLIEQTPTSVAAVHPTLVAALEQVATLDECRRAHQALAETFAERPLRQVSHLDVITHGPDDELAGLLQQAAEDAWRHGAYVESARWWLRAAARTVDPEQVAQRLAGAVTPLMRQGAGPELLTTLDTLITDAREDRRRAGWLRLRLIAGLYLQAPAPDVDGVITLARSIADESTEVAAALMTSLAYVETMSGRFTTAKSIVDSVRTLRAEAGFADLVLHDLVDVLTGAADSGGVLYSDWADNFGDGDYCDPTSPLALAIGLLLWTGGSKAALTLLDRQRDALERTGMFSLLAVSSGQRILASVLDRHWAHADAAFSETAALLLDTDFAAPGFFLKLQHAKLLAARGEQHRCHALIQDVMSTGGQQAPFYQYAELGVRGLLALSNGDAAAAVELLSEARAVQIRMGLVTPGYFDSSGDLFDAFWRSGRAAELDTELSARLTRARASGRPPALAIALRCLGMVTTGNIDQTFGEALAQHLLDPNAFEMARTELAYGQRLRRARRKADACAPLQRAASAFDQLGATPWTDLARSELAACGVRRSAAAGPIVVLTPQERVVADAVAAGLSNAEASRRMFLSVRTVEYHLANVYRKLAIGSRNDLADALVGAGDTPQ